MQGLHHIVHIEEVKKDEQELNILRDKNKDIEKRIALAVIELDEGETKYEALEKGEW